MHIPQFGNFPSRANGRPWLAAWLLILPFGLWLILDKSGKLAVSAMDPSFIGMPRDMAPIDFIKWIAHYACVRLIVTLLLAYAISRVMRARHRVATTLLLTVLLWTGMAAAIALTMPGRGFVQVLLDWSLNAAEQVRLYAICIWRELATVSLAALVVGLMFALLPSRLHKGLRWLVMGVVTVLCILAGFDFAYESATGQPPNAAVLYFSLASWHDLLPLAAAEATPARLFGIVGGALVPAAWYYALSRRPPAWPATPRGERRALLAAVIGTLALFLPVVSTGIVPLERHAEGTFIAFARTMASPEAREANRRVQEQFESSGRPRWHSADIELEATPRTRALNVVIVMLESVRAVSTTPYNPSLRTTPFLGALAGKSLMVQDMSVVYPRTNGAWMAVLGGQYPLSIEGVARWTAANARHKRIRSLPSLLRGKGYATAFFTPTDLNFIDEIAVVRALEFEHIVSEPELQKDGAKRANYMGKADESMLDPIMEWTRAQQQAGRPFLTAIMTNVGHHPYNTPATWTKVQFPGVTDEHLNDYYNCLLYIDGFLHKLIGGYEKLGLADNTVFVILGDHGQFFGEHGIRQAFNGLYEEGIRIPAFVYAPGLPGIEGVVAGARQQVDVLPTVLQLLGYDMKGGRLPGKSLLEPPDPDRKLFYSTSMGNSALASRQGTREYIYYFDRNPMEVFDVASDPGEFKPLAVSQRDRSRVKREMLEWQAASELSMFARPETDPASGKIRWVKP